MGLKDIIKIEPINLQKLPVQKIIIVALTIICCLAIRTCSVKDLEVTNNGVKLQMYNAQVAAYTNTLNKYGEAVSTQNEMIAVRDKKLEKALLAHSNLKKLNEQILVATSIKINDIKANYTSSPKYTYVIHDTLGNAHMVVPDSDCVSVGSKFSSLNKWYSLYGTVEKSDVIIDSLRMMDTTTVNVGSKRQSGFFGAFKERQTVVEIVHSSPYSSTSGMKNITLVDKPKWFQKKTTLFGFGVVIGAAAVIEAVHLFSK